MTDFSVILPEARTFEGERITKHKQAKGRPNMLVDLLCINLIYYVQRSAIVHHPRKRQKHRTK